MLTFCFCFFFLWFCLVVDSSSFTSFFFLLNFYFYYFFKKTLLDDFLFYFLKCPLSSIHNFQKVPFLSWFMQLLSWSMIMIYEVNVTPINEEWLRAVTWSFGSLQLLLPFSSCIKIKIAELPFDWCYRVPHSYWKELLNLPKPYEKRELESLGERSTFIISLVCSLMLMVLPVLD